MPSASIALFTALVGLLSTALTLAVTRLLDARQSRRKAAYSALRVALALEAFAAEASVNIPRVARYEPELPEDYGNEAPYFPDLPAYGDDIDWRDLDQKLTARALMFRTEVAKAKGDISETFSVDDDAGTRTLKWQLERRQSRADELAKDLRRRYRLPALSLADQAADYPEGGL